LQLLLLHLKLAGELLALLQQAFCLHRCLDTVQDDADAGRELFEEAEVRLVEVVQRGNGDDRLQVLLESDGENDDTPRQRLDQRGPDTNCVLWDVCNEDAAFLGGALANEAVAKFDILRITALRMIGILTEQLEAWRPFSHHLVDDALMPAH